MQVLIVPDWRGGNPYLNLLADAARSARPGLDIAFASPSRHPLALLGLAARFRQSRVMHLHWLDNFVESMAWTRSTPLRWVKLALFEIQLMALRLAGRRVVWTIHNLYSHEGANRPLERQVCRALGRRATAVIAHSAQALALAEREYGMEFGSRGRVIPHGNYAARYTAPALDPRAIDERLVDDDCVNLLFFGALRAYKGISELLDALASNPGCRVRVAIAGSPHDAAIAKAVEDFARHDSRVVPVIRFITDEEVPTLFGWSDAVVAPFERTLTSGSVILAFTKERPVILPEVARVIGIATNANAVFYPLGHLAELLPRLRKDSLQEMRVACRQTSASLDWAPIGRSLVEAYGLP